MRLDLLPQVVPAVIGVILAPWFYKDCARPKLAMRGAKPILLTVALLATMLVTLAGVVRAIDLLFDFPERLDDALDGVTILSLAFAVPAIGFLAPGFLIALTGGADGSVPVRYLLTWYRRRWRKTGYDLMASSALVRDLDRSLDRAEVPADPALVAHWRAELDRVVEAAQVDDDALRRAVATLRDHLDAVRPVEPLGDLA